MQVLEVSDYQNVAGAGTAAEIAIQVAAQLLANEITLLPSQVQELNQYFQNTQFEVNQTTLFNAMGDFNIVPIAADNDG